MSLFRFLSLARPGRVQGLGSDSDDGERVLPWSTGWAEVDNVPDNVRITLG